jgi:hypothetical protein
VGSELEAAWDALLAATPTGWYVGRPSYHDERDEWLLYAFDPSERAVVASEEPGVTAVAVERGRRRARDGSVPAELGDGQVPR